MKGTFYLQRKILEEEEKKMISKGWLLEIVIVAF